jgi:hypothetical protein
MSMFVVSIEWTVQGSRQEGRVFFEAVSLEQAKTEAPQAAEIATLSAPDVKITGGPSKFEPVFLAMWDKSRIAALDAPNLLKLERSNIPPAPLTVN